MNLVIIEAIPLLLRAICQIVNAIPGHKILHASTNLDNLESMLSDCQVDMLWLDTSLQLVRECCAFQAIHKQCPELKILLFGMDDTVPEIRKYFKQGASAYLPKTASTEELEAALGCIASGKKYLPTSLNMALNEWLMEPVRKKKAGTKLTEREQEILQLIVDEFTTLEIAKKLYIGQCTVETHRQKIIQKLGVKNTAGIVREAIFNHIYASSGASLKTMIFFTSGFLMIY